MPAPFRLTLPRAAVVLAAALTVLGCRDKGPAGIALVGATVIDGTGGPPLRNAVVVIRGTRIEAVASRDGFRMPKHTEQVDVSGRWIIPGLIDVHAHAARWALPRYIGWGVTAVRDLHNQL